MFEVRFPMLVLRMFRCPLLLAGGLLLAGAPYAAAQTSGPGVPPAPGKFTVSFNVGFQAGDADLTRSTVFQLYDEDAQIDVIQNDIGAAGIFDIGANYRINERWGVGLAYTFGKSDGDGTVTGSIPHPLLFDTPRTLSASASDLKHKEHGFHLQATWHIPFTEKLDFTLSAGPSFFNISQDFIRNVTFSEAPPFDVVNVDEVALLGLRKNAVGFNVGVDATYAITEMFGAGVMARFTRAEADFELNDNDTASVKAGGFQIGGGLRVRF